MTAAVTQGGWPSEVPVQLLLQFCFSELTIATKFGMVKIRKSGLSKSMVLQISVPQSGDYYLKGTIPTRAWQSRRLPCPRSSSFGTQMTNWCRGEMSKGIWWSSRPTPATGLRGPPGAAPSLGNNGRGEARATTSTSHQIKATAPRVRRLTTINTKQAPRCSPGQSSPPSTWIVSASSTKRFTLSSPPHLPLALCIRAPRGTRSKLFLAPRCS